MSLWYIFRDMQSFMLNPLMPPIHHQLRLSLIIMVNFLQNTHNIHPIAYPWKGAVSVVNSKSDLSLNIVNVYTHLYMKKLYEIEKKSKRNNFTYVVDHNAIKYTCSALSVWWHLHEKTLAFHLIYWKTNFASFTTQFYNICISDIWKLNT